LDLLSRLHESFWHGLSYILVAAYLLALSVARFGRPEERPELRKFIVWVPLQLFLAALAAAFEDGSARLHRDLSLAALALSGVGLIYLADYLLFAVLLSGRFRLPMIIRHVLMVASSFIYVLFLFSYFQVDLTGLVATSAVFTMVLGLSLQDTLGNIIGGMALQFDKSIEVGDWIKVGDLTGQVSEITWRYTAVESSRWHTVVIPNSAILRGQVAVVGRRKGKPLYERREIYFNVGLLTPPADVIRVMNEGIQKDAFKNVATEPKPNCIIVDLSKDVGSYCIRYWLTDLAADTSTDSMMRTKLYFILKRAGIPLATPSYDIQMTQRSREAEAEALAAELRERLDALSDVHLFDGLSESERQRLARQMSQAPFAKGEILTKQGTEAHWLYIIVKGEAVVRVEKDGVEAEVARLRAGDFFGEMSLMTGEKRSATVIAETEVDCLRLDKEAFEELLQSRPQIAEEVAELIARRRTLLVALSEDVDREALRRQQEAHKEDLLAAIRAFFALEG
jgi:small-conductance mechanosensitive channel/CRP-like cAMP-binding protein